MTIHLDVETWVDRRTVRDSAAEVQREWQRAGTESSAAWAKGFEKNSDRMRNAAKKAADASSVVIERDAKVTQTRAQLDRATKAYEKAEKSVADVKKESGDGSKDLARAERELEQIRSRLEQLTTQHVTATERLNRALRDEHNAVKSVATMHRDNEAALDGMAVGGQAAMTTVRQLSTSITALSRVGGPIAATAISAGLINLAGVAASAAQSVWLLPGAVGAAAAGFGTLKLATIGFSDALENIRDPEKFAEALRALSPNAQQAALAIRGLLPAFDQLKAATQDALFLNVGEQITQLSTQFLPAVQQMTTSIAGSFNQMFMGVTNQLMTPQTQAALQTTMDNIARSFQNLAPAAAPFTKAIADIMAVGSDFLPELDTSITNAATAFSEFISDARESGQLRQWMADGIAAIKDLAAVAWDVGHVFMSLAPIGQDVLPKIASGFDAIAQVVPPIVNGIQRIGPAVDFVASAARIAHGDFSALKGIIGSVGDFAQLVFSKVRDLLDKMFDPVRAGIDLFNRLPVADIPQIPSMAAGRQYAGGGGSFGPPSPPPPLMQPGRGAPAVPWDQLSPADKWLVADQAAGGATRPGLAPGQYRRRDGSIGYAPPPSALPAIPTPLTGPGASGSSSTPPPFVDPSEYQVTGPAPQMPMVAGPGGPVPYTTNTRGPGSGPGQYVVDPGAVYDAQTREISARNSFEESRLNLLRLEKEGNADQLQLLRARNQVTQDERAWIAAQREVVEAQQGTWKDMEKTAQGFASGMDQIGAALDADFGLSDGLAGFAENLVKFAASLAAAPLLGPLSAISQANPSQGGHGLFGIMGAQGAFGPEHTGIDYSKYGYGGASAMGPAALGGGLGIPMGEPYGLAPGTDTGGYGSSGAVFPPWVHALEQMFGIKASTYAGHQETDRHEAGYAPNPNHENRGIDWSGPVDAMQRFADYLSQIPGALEQVIWQNPNTGQATEIAGGRPQPGYFSGALGGHQNHVHTRQSAAIPLPGLPGSQYQLPSGAPMSTTTPIQTLAYPALNNPAAPGVPIPAGVPSMPGGLPSMGVGMPQAAPFTAPSLIPGAPMSGPPGAGSGFSGVAGGLTGAAISAGAAGLDMLAPGAGQAAQTGIQLANRTIGYLGQLAGIGVGGILETFGVSNGNPLADPLKSLPGRVLAGIMGARPALPNAAGQAQQQAQQQGQQQQHGQNAGQPPGPLVHIDTVNQAPKQAPDSVANSVANQFKSAEISQGFKSR